MKRRTLSLGAVLVAVGVTAGVAAGVACGPSGFQSPTIIDSVRILATRADHDESFGRPGDTVTLEALTVDGRASKATPAVLYWIPFVCENPASDLYYECFASFAGGGAGGDAGTGPGAGGSGVPSGDAGIAAGDAGTGAGDAGAGEAGAGEAGTATPSPVFSAGTLASFLTPGTDLTPYLPTGPFTFVIPPDIITKHPPVPGSNPYGLVVLFNIACAGHVKVVGFNASGGPQQIPIGCFDDAGNALGADDYVIGFTREYVYPATSPINTNPEVDGILFGGVETPTDQVTTHGTAVPAPVKVSVHPCTNGSCDAIPLEMDVPSSSWNPLHKSIWVDYYAANGSVGSEARLLYDVSAGKVSDAKNPVTYTPPPVPGTDTLWAVVHDSNEGATWLEVDITVK